MIHEIFNYQELATGALGVFLLMFASIGVPALYKLYLLRDPTKPGTTRK